MQLFDKIRRSTPTAPTAKLAATVVLKFLPLLTLACTSSLYAQTPGAHLLTNASEVVRDQLPSGPAINAFDPAMVQPLIDEARHLQETGGHTEAVRLYKEAIHILRINLGLYDESQIAVLEEMIESEMSLQNWELVDRHYGYMENLYRRLYAVDDPRLESGLQKVVSWHVNALNVNIDGKRVEHLQQANKLFKMRLQIAELTLTADDPKFEFLLRNIAICERQLFLASDLNKEMQQRQDRRRQRALIADID